MQNENAEHEEKRNNGADAVIRLGQENGKHIAGTEIVIPCAKRGQKDKWRDIKGGRT
jgi:hypothetical protein